MPCKKKRKSASVQQIFFFIAGQADNIHRDIKCGIEVYTLPSMEEWKSSLLTDSVEVTAATLKQLSQSEISVI